MVVSSGLQKYFDSQRKKKGGSIKDKLAKIESQIDPEFLRSFQVFHDRILDIVDDEESESIAEEELDSLEVELKTANRKHQLQKAKAILDNTEKHS